MPDERRMIHIRLPRPLLKRVDYVSVDLDEDRAKTIEHLLEIALETLDAGSEKTKLAAVR
ncbi:MAG TPA: hypothetical protein VJB57_08915 [Dehalococcoidia bacterium]|nr:hypothetical protein [Dehalococcoidia bacterium]